MTALVGFLTFLVVTLAFLGAVVVTGLKAKRKAHIPLVVCTVISLLVAIYYAEKLGESYDLEAAGAIYPIHLTIAKIATLSYLLPVITGVMTLKNPSRRKLHGKIAFAVIGLTVVTAITGTWMVMASPPL